MGVGAGECELQRVLEAALHQQPADELAAGAGDGPEALVVEVVRHAQRRQPGEPGVDLVLLRLAPSMELLEAAGARLARSGLGRWLTVRHSILARIVPTQYASKPTDQERSLLDGEPRRYLIAYPFTKSTDWYLLGREARQGVMNEHMRVGRGYPGVRQLLGSSFGMDDGDFLVAYDTDDLAVFGDLVRELRGTESRRSTVNDRPILLGLRRSMTEFIELVGGTP